jgi:hypothetical protein
VYTAVTEKAITNNSGNRSKNTPTTPVSPAASATLRGGTGIAAKFTGKSAAGVRLALSRASTSDMSIARCNDRNDDDS